MVPARSGSDRPAERPIALRSPDERSDGSADDEGRNDEPNDDERRSDEPDGDEKRNAKEPNGWQRSTDEEHLTVLHRSRSGDTDRLSDTARDHTGRLGRRVRQADHQ